MEEIGAQVEDALTDARVPRYVKQLIQNLYYQLSQVPWNDQQAAMAMPSIFSKAPLTTPAGLTNNAFGMNRRPNLSTLPSIPMRSQGFFFEPPPTHRYPELTPTLGVPVPSMSRQGWHIQGPHQAQTSHPLVAQPPLSASPPVQAPLPAHSVPISQGSAPLPRLTPEQASQDDLGSGPMDQLQTSGAVTARTRRPARDVVFTIRIDAVGSGATREVDVVSISPSDHRVLIASRIINFNEIQQLKAVAEAQGYQEMSSMPYGERVNGQGWYSPLNYEKDPCIRRVCRRLAAVAMSEISQLKTVFIARFILGAKIRWQGDTTVKKVVYVFLNEGQDGVLSLPDNGVKIRAQKGTAVCLANDVKGLEKTTGGVFPDGYKLVLLAVF